MRKFNNLFALSAIAVLLTASQSFAQDDASVNIVDNPGAGYFDVFYTPSLNGEFAAWDLIVTPTLGGLRDTSTGDRSDDVRDPEGSGPADDTFANTVFSSFGAAAASYIFTEYNPGSTFPPVAADPAPTVGGDPNQLNWTIFSTDAGDGRTGLEPYHMGRVQYTQGGSGTFDIAFFEGGADPVDGGTATGTYGGSTANTPPVVTDLFAGEDWDQETQAFNGTPASYQLQATDTEDGDDENLSWTLDGFTGPFDAGGNPIAGAGNGNQTVSSTGLFEWDPTGSTNGYYFAAVTVEDSGALTDSGILRVQVPEPSTMLLAGLSLVGVFARRRNS